jgi:hypothetical protein
MINNLIIVLKKKLKNCNYNFLRDFQKKKKIVLKFLISLEESCH